MGRISALTELTTLASNDYLVVLDSSANIAKKISIANAFGIPDFGWTATGETHTYSSWSSTTRIGVITVPSDATTKYQPGMRYRISQSTGGTKYGIITKVTSTTLTVFFPSGTTLNNETITTPHYATVKAPLGFPTEPRTWSLFGQSSSATSASIGNGATSNHGSLSLTLGIGAWKLSYRRSIFMGTASTVIRFYLSTANNSVSGVTGYDVSASGAKYGAGVGSTNVHQSASVSNILAEITAQATFYQVLYNGSGASRTVVTTDDETTGEIVAECAYL